MKLRYLSGILLLTAGLFLGSCNDDDYDIATGNIVSSVVTVGADVTAVSATITGTVLDLSSLSSASYTVGVYYGTDEDPKTNGTRVNGTIDTDGTVTASITGLTTGTTYYYCVFVTLQSKVTYYGEVLSFVATDSAIATADASSVTAVSANLGGTVNGVSDLLESESSSVVYGIKVYANESELQDDGRDYVVSGSTNAYTLSLTGLVPNTTYYYAAYLALDGSYEYGETKSFTTETYDMEYVDLGLSVEWASCNLGATSEADCGGLFGWGDTTGMLWSTRAADYGQDADISGTDYDPCSKVGGRMPTADEIAELLNNTTQTWEEVDGVGGYRFTASNGNSIFLPAAGAREGIDTSGEGTDGYYWSGSIESTSTDYAKSLMFSSSSIASTVSYRYKGLSLRPVAVNAAANVVTPASGVIFGDIEGNGRLRIEIYNIYGSGSADNPIIDPTEISFTQNMVVTFTLTGITGNLVSGAAGSYVAGLEYADAYWSANRWSNLSTSDSGMKYDAVVTGDGTYVVWMEGATAVNDIAVFCVDIEGLWQDIEDTSLVGVEVNSIALDADVEQEVNADIVQFQNKDGDGTNGRIEIYNEYGNGANYAGYYNDQLYFNGMMIVDFTITGIDGNLVSGASASYSTELSYADASWDPSYWGGAGYGGATVTGDGSYEVFAYLNGDCEGAVVWTIEIYGLWADLVDTSQVSVSVDKVTIPGKQQ